MRMLIWSLYDLAALFVFPFLWLAVYQASDSVAGMTRQDIVTYYILIIFLNGSVRIFIDYVVIDVIREGNLNQFLTKPLSFFWYQYCTIIPYQMLKFFLLVCFFVAGFHWIRPFFLFPTSLLQIAFLILALIAAHILRTLWDFLLGITALWLEDSSGVQSLEKTFTMILSGQLAPLVFFPLWFQAASVWLPFKYLLSFPIEVYLGKVSGSELLVGFGVTFVWCVILCFVIRRVWRAGLYHYQGVGDR